MRMIALRGHLLALAERGAGRPFLFQHGLCGDHRQTLEAAPEVPGWQVLTLEMRGHGASPLLGDLSLDDYAQDLIALLRGLPGPAVIGGISMGAALALKVARSRPDLVAGLVLVRPAWGTGGAPDNLAPNRQVARLLALGEGPRAFAASAEGLRLAKEAPDNLASLLGFFDRVPRDETARLLDTLSAEPLGLSEADLSALRLPALVLGCAEDALHPLALARDLARRIPEARLVEVPAKGRDKPAHLAALHREIAAFLKEF